jgi:hypothetical protein
MLNEFAKLGRDFSLFTLASCRKLHSGIGFADIEARRGLSPQFKRYVLP